MSDSYAFDPHGALVQLFDRLRAEAGLPLGIDDFLQLFEAIEQGFGLPDREALRRLCRALWAGSRDDMRLLDQLFDLMIPNDAAVHAALEWMRRPEPSGTAEQPAEPQTTEPTGAPPPGPAIPPTTGESQPAPEPRGSAPVVQPRATRAPSTAAPSPRPPIRVIVDERGQPAARFAIDDEELFPLTRREMQQSWRHLRRMVREGPPTELDVEETVRRIMRQGVLLAPVMLPPRINRTRLLLLIDRDGSMIPFHQFTRRLVETALRGGRVGQTQVFNFHNYPLTHLYTYEQPARAEPIETILRNLPPSAVVLIVSDAGAARGRVNPERVEQTAVFLSRLRSRIARVAWLNPVPRSANGEQDRWNHSSAGAIARMTPMFEMNRRGLDAAIDVLRGRSIGLASAEIAG